MELLEVNCQKLDAFFSSPRQLPNICSSGDVTCKLEVMSQGHCLEYNYDYDNGFSIGGIYVHLHETSHLYLNGSILSAYYFFLCIYQHRGVGATAGVLRAPRTTPTLSQALPRAPGGSPASSGTAACNRTTAARGTEK